MAGISANALKGANYPENRKKYNGIEFTNELDLDIYDAFYRGLDPQIGRWNQIDPKIENMEAWSPYVSNYDNPIRYNDFLGDEGNDPNKKSFWQGAKTAYAGFFNNIANAVIHPVETVKSAFSPKALAENALNAVTMGAYGTAKSAIDNTRTIINEGAYGAGKIVGEKAAELTVAVVAEGGAKAVGALRGAGGASAETMAAGNVAEDLVRVRHHTSPEGLKGIKNSQTINASRGKPYGVDVELSPFVRPSKANFGQYGKGAYIEFSVPANKLSPIPGYLGAESGTGARIVTEGAPLDIKNSNPTFKKWKLW